MLVVFLFFFSRLHTLHRAPGSKLNQLVILGKSDGNGDLDLAGLVRDFGDFSSKRFRNSVYLSFVDHKLIITSKGYVRIHLIDRIITQLLNLRHSCKVLSDVLSHYGWNSLNKISGLKFMQLHGTYLLSPSKIKLCIARLFRQPHRKLFIYKSNSEETVDFVLYPNPQYKVTDDFFKYSFSYSKIHLAVFHSGKIVYMLSDIRQFSQLEYFLLLK